jgi:hypothetical protein
MFLDGFTYLGLSFPQVQLFGFTELGRYWTTGGLNDTAGTGGIARAGMMG